MAKALQRRRGTTEEHASFTGLEGEFTYDTTEKRVVAHDGVTAGGTPMAKKSEVVAIESAVDKTAEDLGGLQQSFDQEKLDIRALIADELKKYLPLAGGTMTGAIYADGGVILGKTDDGSVWFSGGTKSNDNPYIQLFGGNYPSASAGCINIRPSNTTESSILSISPSGEMKMDSDKVLTTGDKETVGSWITPSTQYETLSITASGALFTAPANGYFVLAINGSAGATSFGVLTNGYVVSVSKAQNSGFVACYMPCAKGDSVKAEYQGSINYLRFVYAKGAI